MSSSNYDEDNDTTLVPSCEEAVPHIRVEPILIKVLSDKAGSGKLLRAEMLKGDIDEQLAEMRLRLTSVAQLDTMMCIAVDQGLVRRQGKQFEALRPRATLDTWNVATRSDVGNLMRPCKKDRWPSRAENRFTQGKLRNGA